MDDSGLQEVISEAAFGPQEEVASLDGENLRRALGPTSLSYYSISGIDSFFMNVPQTITVTAYEQNGARKYYGGDSFKLRIENTCSISSTNVRCIPSSSHSNIPGLPYEVIMSNRGDGTYYTSVSLAGAGSVTVSVSVLTNGGIYTEYFHNTYASGTPAYTYISPTIDNYWGGDMVYPAYVYDNVSGLWNGWLVPTWTGWHYF